MMFRPALRTSHSAFCGAASGISTTLPGRPRSPIRSTRSRSFGSSAALSSPENSTSRIAAGLPISAVSTVGRNAGFARLSSIIVRSTSSTAVGPSLTMCCAASIAAWKVGKLTTPSTLARGSSASCSVRLRVYASVPSAPTSRCARLTLPSARVRPLALVLEDVEVVAGDAAHHLRPAALDLGRVLQRQAAHEGRDAGGAAAQLRDRPEVEQLAARQPRARAEHVVHHVAVGDRARAAGVVARHAAQRGLRAGRHVDREPQAVRLQLRVQVVEHQAGLDGRGALRPRSRRARAGSVCCCR